MSKVPGWRFMITGCWGLNGTRTTAYEITVVMTPAIGRFCRIDRVVILRNKVYRIEPSNFRG
ncbi:hypothetical protein ALQ93_200123 [Pseudomonas syringae pv. pisi]|nr:hypothetical protein ALQ93_200123 [Pseudomonas syringae pv. pisi]